MTYVARLRCLGGIPVLLLAAGALAAQAPASDQESPVASEAASPVPDSTATDKPAKKKGGLFGKVKSLAGNKTVQQVAKTAACTMVPGGQAIAGAIDAASSNSVGEAATGAAAAASGSTCMPGGLGGTGIGGLGIAGAATQDAMGYGSMEGMSSPDAIARCLGLRADEYLDFTNPTRGEPRPMTKDEMTRQAKLAKKIDMPRYQACMMQQQSARMPAHE